MKKILILLISFLFLLSVGCSNDVSQSTEPEITVLPTVNFTDEETLIEPTVLGNTLPSLPPESADIDNETLIEPTVLGNTLPSLPPEGVNIDNENITITKPTENIAIPESTTLSSNNSNGNLCQHKNIYPANCINTGYCYDCRMVLEEKNPNIHPSGQEHGLYDIKAATCAEEGYTGDLKCKSCYGVIEYGKATPKLNTHYTFYYENKATCCKLAKCEICGVNYGEYNPNNHSHQFITKNKVEATCLKNGYSGDLCCKDCEIIIYPGRITEGEHKNDISTCIGQYCSVCNAKTSDFTWTSDNNTIQHLNIITKNKNIPVYSCQDGYTGDTYCTECQKTIKKGEKIKATQEHNYIVISEEYSSNYYYKKSQCSICGSVSEIKISIGG